MPRDAGELAHRLAREAEAVCRYYLSNGRREGGTGWSATSTIRRVARCLCVSRNRRKDPPVNGPMLRLGSMAISSMSFAKAEACVTFGRSPRRQDAF